MSTTLTKPPVFAVCLTRQELYVARDALLDCHERMTRDRGPYAPMTDRHAATYHAFIRCDIILRDAGGVDDTK